jgi:hypothetical protein
VNAKKRQQIRDSSDDIFDSPNVEGVIGNGILSSNAKVGQAFSGVGVHQDDGERTAVSAIFVGE